MANNHAQVFRAEMIFVCFLTVCRAFWRLVPWACAVDQIVRGAARCPSRTQTLFTATPSRSCRAHSSGPSHKLGGSRCDLAAWIAGLGRFPVMVH